MELNGTNFKQQLSNNYECEKCNYITVRKNNYTAHLLTSKHLKETNGTNFKHNQANQAIDETFLCYCGKPYKTAAGLWKHKKKCIDEIGRVGFIKGMSNIITSKLNLLAENKRPVHCTDAKREVMYVREENKWEKDNANKEKMRLLVKKIDRKLNPVISVFHKDRIKPNSTDSEHKASTNFI